MRDSNYMEFVQDSSISIDYGLTNCIEIATQCKFETIETFEDRIPYYQSKDYSYIPIPGESKYFNTYSHEMCKIEPNQWVESESPILNKLKLIDEYGFVLLYHPEKQFVIDESGFRFKSASREDRNRSDIYGSPRAALEEWPEYSEEIIDALDESNNLYIITTADLNNRQLRAVLYRMISGIEVILANKIKSHHVGGEELIHHMNPMSVGRWKKSEYEVGQRHPAEYMDFGELKKAASYNPEIVEELNYKSKDEFDGKLGGIKDLRNRVMHPSNSLIKSEEDLSEVIDTISKIEKFVLGIGGSVIREPLHEQSI